MRILLLIFAGFFAANLPAQTGTNSIKGGKQSISYDKIFLLNGEKREGNVTEMDIESVKFIHAGESLVYTFKRNTISKIEFSSGRIEVINMLDTTSIKQATKNELIAHNSVAILPVGFSREGRYDLNNVEMQKAQNEVYSILTEHSQSIKIQDPLSTNANLAKQGITIENLKGHEISELAEILKVEYLLIISVVIDKTGTNTSGQTVTTKSSGSKNKESYSSWGSTHTSQDFKTNVEMLIFNKQGDRIYSKERTSFWTTSDAFKFTIAYLLKRSPIWAL